MPVQRQRFANRGKKGSCPTKSGLAVLHALIECSENTNAHFMFGMVGPAVPGGVQRTSPTEPSLRSGRFELKCDRIEGHVRRLG